MDEQLELIQNLRRQIDEINIIKKINEKRYNEINNSINEFFNNIQNMNKLLNDAKEKFESAKVEKIFKYSIPCGIGATIITFVLLIIFEDFSNAILNIFLSGVCSIVSGTVISCVPVMILNMFNDFFIKRFPELKDQYHRIQNIENYIMVSERNFNKMKNKRDNLHTLLKRNEEILRSKLIELYDATEYYFNHLENKDICNSTNIIFDTNNNTYNKKKIRRIGDK